MLLETKTCDFDWPAPEFDLATPAGVRHSRDGVIGEKGMLVAFICNHCPYVVAVIDRLAEDMNALEAMGIGCVCIMSNDYRDYPADAPEKMTVFAQTHGLQAPYLVDENQSVGRAYGAVCTPDFFGFDADGGLQYRGRLDDVGMRGDAGARVPELVNAMRQIAETGQGPRDQTPSMGCSIKWS
ncbi:thioredoxin family protein [Sulfitobacter aestuariivivens]|uniref:Thioredoxin family protein n=1 Tax=Sulfitobacter aestuariivivens TaxID=2766981 RepID=A0A927DA24_9RHOB|nr:thioredoxin family protein [Sulfitobacter aestuariivivens]MBD3665476.1 thioredoxin family protein [Sulfitobacter aestuariivivens]